MLQLTGYYQPGGIISAGTAVGIAWLPWDHRPNGVRQFAICRTITQGWQDRPGIVCINWAQFALIEVLALYNSEIFDFRPVTFSGYPVA